MLTELECYYHRINDLRNQINQLITGCSTEALNWRPLQSNGDPNEQSINSIAILCEHIAGAEDYWISEIIGNSPEIRNRIAEFLIIAQDKSELIKRLDKTNQRTSDVFKNLSNDALNEFRIVDGHEVHVRWGIVHVIDHTALHLGHMQITYQLYNKGVGIQSPFWYERLPKV